MNKRVFLAGLLAPAIFLCAFASARAGETTVGVTLDATIGTHYELRSGTTTLPVLPIPFFTIEHREGRFSVFLEGVPPIGPVPIKQSASPQTVSTQISMFDGSFRYAIPHTRLWIGVGETVINQSTDYRFEASQPNGAYTVTLLEDEVQSSRLAGTRFEVGANVWHNAHQRFDVSCATSPRMHALLVEHDRSSFTTTDPNGVSGLSTGTLSAPETASLVDAQARWSSTHGRSTLSVGLRYLNHVSVYDDFNAVADRNRFLLPFVGWSTRL